MKKKRAPDMSVSQKVASLRAAKKKKVAKSHFFRDMKEEMKKVSWTTKRELAVCTKIVVGSIFVLGLGIYLVDLIIRYCLQGIGGFLELIT